MEETISCQTLNHNFKGQFDDLGLVLKLRSELGLSVCVRVCVCVRTSDTCRTQQLHQGGAVTLCNLQHALDDAEEVGQETKTHLREKILGV